MKLYYLQCKQCDFRVTASPAMINPLLANPYKEMTSVDNEHPELEAIKQHLKDAHGSDGHAEIYVTSDEVN